MKLNTHNLTIKGIKRAAGDTINWGPYGDHCNEIAYDTKTGKVWVKHMSTSSYTDYNDPGVIMVRSSDKMTMQEIADAIANEIEMGDLRYYI